MKVYVVQYREKRKKLGISLQNCESVHVSKRECINFAMLIVIIENYSRRGFIFPVTQTFALKEAVCNTVQLMLLVMPVYTTMSS